MKVVAVNGMIVVKHAQLEDLKNAGIVNYIPLKEKNPFMMMAVVVSAPLRNANMIDILPQEGDIVLVNTSHAIIFEVENSNDLDKLYVVEEKRICAIVHKN